MYTPQLSTLNKYFNMYIISHLYEASLQAAHC